MQSSAQHGPVQSYGFQAVTVLLVKVVRSLEELMSGDLALLSLSMHIYMCVGIYICVVSWGPSIDAARRGRAQLGRSGLWKTIWLSHIDPAKLCG